MVFFNYSTMQMAAKVVYYGPGLCGKTTNLQFIYEHTSNDSRGEMVSLETETDRTLFFDLLPIDVGSIGGFNTRVQLYTVPGQVFYNTTRKLVLKGVDGVVFVADSQRPMLQANVESFKNLEENLAEMGLTVDELPLVLQYNKRDLSSICTVEELNQALNGKGWHYFEASAINGQGVFETLKGISKLTLLSLKQKLAKGAPETARSTPPKPVAAAKPAPQPAPAAPPRPQTPSRPAPAAAPTPADTPAPRPAAKTTSRPKSREVDVLGELEKLRREVKRPLGTRARAQGNGHHEELSREIRLTLKRADFQRLRRFTLNLQVEDADSKVVDAVRNLHIDIQDPASLERLLLNLKIALSPRG